MGLKRLLADLTGTEGFKQKSLGYDFNATSIHNSTDQPFITYGFSDTFELENNSDEVKTEQNIVRLGNPDNPVLYKTDLDKQVGSRTTGISSISINRREEDFERISKFLQTGKGIRFIRNQIGLQLSNPRVDAPMKGALDNFMNFGITGIPDPNQTEYNPLKTLLQSSLSGIVNTGQGAAREGLIPFVHSGYYNNFFDRKGASISEGMSNPDNNKLVYLGTNIGHIKKEQEEMI